MEINSYSLHSHIQKVVTIIICSLLVSSCIRPRVINYQTANQIPPLEKPTKDLNQVSIMSWNMKFGGGRIEFALDCIGDRKTMTKEEVVKNLDSICSLLNTVKPEILFLQEVDRKAKRSQKIDQVQYILDHTDYLNYSIYSAQWKFGGRLFWKFGNKMNTGNAILSQHPIIEAKTQLLPGDRIILFKRHLQKASVQVGTDTLKLVNLHAAVGGGVKAIEKTVSRISKEIQDAQDENTPILIGGDFNALPPNNPTCKCFTDAQCTGIKSKGSNYCDKKKAMHPLYKINSVTPAIDTLNAALEKNRTCSLDSATFWTRKLDYLFTTAPHVNGVTIQKTTDYSGNFPEPMGLSDHAPILITIQFPSIPAIK